MSSHPRWLIGVVALVALAMAMLPGSALAEEITPHVAPPRTVTPHVAEVAPEETAATPDVESPTVAPDPAADALAPTVEPSPDASSVPGAPRDGGPVADEGPCNGIHCGPCGGARHCDFVYPTRGVTKGWRPDPLDRYAICTGAQFLMQILWRDRIRTVPGFLATAFGEPLPLEIVRDPELSPFGIEDFTENAAATAVMNWNKSCTTWVTP